MRPELVAPERDWRAAVVMQAPHSPEPHGIDRIAATYVDGLRDAVGPPIEQLHSMRWLSPWVAVIDRSPSELPSRPLMLEALQNVDGAFRIRQVVVFGEGPDALPDFHWWSPALADAIRAFPWSGELLGRMIGACDVHGRAGGELASAAHVQGVVAWSLHASVQRAWPQFRTGTWEAVTDSERLTLTFDAGRVVGGSGAGSAPDSARAVLAASRGQLWWHKEPRDEAVGVWQFGEL
ncbi:MAG: hypothetical protein AAF799_36235 [Myxococcota bacterium]